MYSSFQVAILLFCCQFFKFHYNIKYWAQLGGGRNFNMFLRLNINKVWKNVSFPDGGMLDWHKYSWNTLASVRKQFFRRSSFTSTKHETFRILIKKALLKTTCKVITRYNKNKVWHLNTMLKKLLFLWRYWCLLYFI